MYGVRVYLYGWYITVHCLIRSLAERLNEYAQLSHKYTLKSLLESSVSWCMKYSQECGKWKGVYAKVIGFWNEMDLKKWPIIWSTSTYTTSNVYWSSETSTKKSILTYILFEARRGKSRKNTQIHGSYWYVCVCLMAIDFVRWTITKKKLLP